MRISIIGSGSLGQAIAGLAGSGGSAVELISSSDADGEVTGDIVVLAVPAPAIEPVIAQHGAQLAGKVVVDMTNPLNFETFDSLTVAADSSAVADIAAALPQSRVVKAFNTGFADMGGGRPTIVLLAGDDADAKAMLVGVISAAGLRAVDVGGPERARELEAAAFLQLSPRIGHEP